MRAASFIYKSFIVQLLHKHIAPFLQTKQNKASRLLSYMGLGVGIVLLLCAIQMYVNINQLLRDKSPKKTGYDFLSVTKMVTNENMDTDNSFSPQDVDSLAQQPFLEGATPLISNQFKVIGSAGDMIPFSTNLFVEAVDNNYIDTVPASFTWQPGQKELPIILSADFLEMYNVFAPSWDLPQLSEKTIASLGLSLRCYGNRGEETYKGRVVALSYRINSILVPKNFVEWANQNLEGVAQKNVSRVYIKTKDANNPALLSHFEKLGYHVNKDKTRFGRVKQVLQAIVSGMAGFGVLVILLAMVLFSFYLQLMIARSKENLQLLLTLGYSPGWLSKTVARQWVPIYIMVVLVALAITALLHWLFKTYAMAGRDDLPPFINWTVIATAAILLVLSIFINYRMVKKLLNKL
jgi:uncharacterized membrane protein YidH (DUF202 family)